MNGVQVNNEVGESLWIVTFGEIFRNSVRAKKCLLFQEKMNNFPQILGVEKCSPEEEIISEIFHLFCASESH